MKDNFENEELFDELYTLEDENGNEGNYELLDTLEENGEKYFALVPYYENEEDIPEEEDELLILKAKQVDGEEILVSIESEDEFNKIAQIFIEKLDDIEIV